MGKLPNAFAEETGTPTTPLVRTTGKEIDRMLHVEDLGKILEAAGINLDSGQFFCLEPQDVMEKKDRDQLWCAFICRDKTETHLEIRRPDLKVCRTVLIWNENGYWQMMIEEEPGSEGLSVGSLVIHTNNAALIKVWRIGAKGKIGHWTAKGGSLTRGETVPEDATFIGFIFSNFPRITGRTIIGAPIPVYEVKSEDPLQLDNSRFGNEKFNDANRPDGYEEIAGLSDLFSGDDGRTLAAASKVFSSSSFDLYKTIENMANMAGVSFESIANHIQLNEKQRAELMYAQQAHDNRDE